MRIVFSKKIFFFIFLVGVVFYAFSGSMALMKKPYAYAQTQHESKKNAAIGTRGLGFLDVKKGAHAVGGKRIALIIGNSLYNDIPSLKNPLHDAQDMNNALKRLGFETIIALDADKRTLDRKISQFIAQIDYQTIALFYYAGHGIQINHENYLIARDAPINNVHDFIKHSINVRSLLHQMGAKKAYMNLMILDACRDNPFVKIVPNMAGELPVAHGFKSMEGAVSSSNTLVAFSTAEDQLAQDGYGRNSPFTKALLNWIEQPDIELQDLFTKVRQSVKQHTNNQQIPWETGNLTRDFYFSRSIFADKVGGQERSKRTRPKSPSNNGNNNESVEGRASSGDEAIFWQSVQSLKDPKAKKQGLLEYKAKFPNGQFASIADLQLAELNAANTGNGNNQSSNQNNTQTGTQNSNVSGNNSNNSNNNGNSASNNGSNASSGDVGDTDNGDKNAALPNFHYVEPAEPYELQRFSRSLSLSQREQVQESLAVLGYYHDAIDGIFSAKTFGAIYAYQADRGDIPTGILTKEQMIVLFADVAKNLRNNPEAKQAVTAQQKNAPSWYVATTPDGKIGYVYGIKGRPGKEEIAPPEKVLSGVRPGDDAGFKKKEQEGFVYLDKNAKRALQSWSSPPPPSPITRGKVMFKAVFEAPIKKTPHHYAKSIGQIAPGEWIIVTGRLSDFEWYQVENLAGNIGYIEAKNLSSMER